jgi:aminopeptidase N
MPVASQRAAGKGLRVVTFATTPKMSSYLLFFGLGDFERVHRRIGGVDVGVVVKRGDTADAAFALKAATEILPYYNAYFGKPYPLPKLDLIAGPGSSQFFGAMENWGAIFYFERDLLIDPRISTQRDRQAVYVTIAHEMAHQWFGDLVTMAWWDDLWLNEGFASWMENKASDHFHPEWKLWLQAIEDKNDVMQTDARDGTHPIITPINDVLQAGGAFDGITYQKGEAVIRMLEAYVGEDVFRAGVRRYIAAHAYGNTVTDDLWREIDAVSPGRPITQIAHDFTLQSGVPLIRERSAICDNGRTRLSLEQGRFAADETARTPRVWRVPVAVALPGGGTERAVVAGAAGDEVNITGCRPDLSVVLNAGQTSYFRSVYAPPGLAALSARFASLSPEDQLGLIVDSQALAYVGDQPMAAFLNLTRHLDANTDPIVWRRVASALRDLDVLYDGSTGRGAFRAYVRGLLGPVLARMGWDAAPGESDNIALMRTEVLTTLGAAGDPAVIAEARKRFSGFVRDQASLDAAARDVVLTIVARQADAATWDQLHALARAARTELERAELYRLLGRAADRAIAQRGLDLALSGEASATTEPSIIRAVSALHPALAEDFAIAHWSHIEALLEPDSRPEFVPRLVAQGADPALIDKMNAFADAHIPADARQEVRKAAAQVAFRAMLRQQRLPDVDRWLAGPESGAQPNQ